MQDPPHPNSQTSKLSLFHPSSQTATAAVASITIVNSTSPPASNNVEDATTNGVDCNNNSQCTDRGNNSPSPYGKSAGRWTIEEHRKFIEGIKIFGRNWKKVEDHIGTRSGAQIRSHAQKFFNRLEKNQLSQAAAAAAAEPDFIGGVSSASPERIPTNKQAIHASSDTSRKLTASPSRDLKDINSSSPFQPGTKPQQIPELSQTSVQKILQDGQEATLKQITGRPRSGSEATASEENKQQQQQQRLLNNNGESCGDGGVLQRKNNPQLFSLEQQQQQKKQQLESSKFYESAGVGSSSIVAQKMIEMRQLLSERAALLLSSQSSYNQDNRNYLPFESSAPLLLSLHTTSPPTQHLASNNHNRYLFDEKESEELIEKYTKQIQENNQQENSYFIEHHLADISESRLYDICALGQNDTLAYKPELYEPSASAQKKGRSRFGSFKLHDEENEVSNQRYQSLRKASIDDQELKKKIKLNDQSSSVCTATAPNAELN